VAIVTGSLPIAAYTVLVNLLPDLPSHLPQWFVTALAFLGLIFAQYLAWCDARRERDAALAEMKGERTPPKVTILEPPRIESLSPSGGERRMVTFPRVAVENVSSGPQRVCLRLFLDGWDSAYIPPWKPPEFFVRGGPTKLPDEIDLQPGQQVIGQIEFRYPYDPVTASATLRLVAIRPSAENVLLEFSSALSRQ
jgi:hypothetical protein